MKALTETEMQYFTGGANPIDSAPLPPDVSTNLLQIQLQWFLNNLAQQQQAAYLRWLHVQAS
jgi:hypothetical protein